MLHKPVVCVPRFAAPVAKSARSMRLTIVSAALNPAWPAQKSASEWLANYLMRSGHPRTRLLNELIDLYGKKNPGCKAARE